MNNLTIAVTGANGYLGSYLVNYFSKLNFRISAFVRNIPEEKVKGVTYIKYALEDELLIENFEEIDYVIHAAFIRYDVNKKADNINYLGTQRLVKVCSKKQIPIIFLSSFSAHSKAISHYGTNKLKCEKLFDTNTKDSILKISFIIGKGGILKEMIDKMKSSNFFPLVGGNRPLQYISIEDFAKVISVIIENKLKGKFYLGNEEVITMKKFYRLIARKINRKITFVPIPIYLLLLGSYFFEFLRIKLPVSSESILGLMKMRSFKTEETQEKIKMNFLNVQESLRLV